MTEDWPERWKYKRSIPVTKAEYRRLLSIGVHQCTWCRVLVPYRHSKWCSDDCSREYRIRANPYYARIRVERRDNGICALCGSHDEEWEADHIIPVSKGGGCCGLDNLRTLCRKCHIDTFRELYRDPEAVAHLLRSDKKLLGVFASYTQPTTPNVGAAWHDQDAELLRLRAQGLGYRKIAGILGRTRDGVRYRLELLSTFKVEQ